MVRISTRAHGVTLRRKPLSSFGSDLTIRHLVNRLDTNDPSTESGTLKMRLQLPLCLTRSEDQDRFCITGLLPNVGPLRPA